MGYFDSNVMLASQGVNLIHFLCVKALKNKFYSILMISTSQSHEKLFNCFIYFKKIVNKFNEDFTFFEMIVSLFFN